MDENMTWYESLNSHGIKCTYTIVNKNICNNNKLKTRVTGVYCVGEHSQFQFILT